MKDRIYILEHVYEIEDEEEIKFIGAFSSKKKAEDVILILKDKKGFRDYPIECFSINEIILDNYGWEEGFVNWEEANQ